jgi:hypothetical protein
MPLFDIFKKKDVAQKGIVESTSKEIVTSHEAITFPQSTFTLHEDLRGLVWIADGKFKNYDLNAAKAKSEKSFETNGIRFSISMMGQNEPSLIFTKERISAPKDGLIVERPPYFPTYIGLTQEQKWTYLKLLTNPYDTNIDIGFVFILYYGLERHLLEGDFESAFRVILKLRDAHTNKSFQSYSANALVLTSMLYKRADLALEFIKSLNKGHELAFSDNLFVVCYFSFDLPLKAADLMRMAKTFEFTNISYIKNQPKIFEECLCSVMEAKIGSLELDIKRYVTKTELRKIRVQEVNIFANPSIIDKVFPVPLVADIFQFKKIVNQLLELAHEKTKETLAVMRKSGQKIENEHISNKKTVVNMFDEAKEKDLLQNLKQYLDKPVQRHFCYLEIQDFYYKYRDLDKKYLDKCIEYCWVDINSLDELQQDYVSQEISRVNQLSQYRQPNEVSTEIDAIKKTGFVGNIPAFSRLAIIFEKQKEFEKAINICNLAISYGYGHESMIERKEKLIEKANKK